MSAEAHAGQGPRNEERSGGDERPRILHVCTVPQTLFFLRGQAEYFRQRGFDYTAVASPGPNLDRFRAEEDVPVDAVRMTRRISPLRDLVSLAGLFRVIRCRRPHVLHAHTPKASLLAMVAGTIARVPVRIYHLHGLPLETATGWKRRVLAAAERLTARLAHEVFAVSPSVRDRVVEEGLCPPDRIRVLGNGSIGGVDAAGRFDPEGWRQEGRELRRRWEIPADAVVVGYVGRLVREKGIDDLALAWREIRAAHPRAHLLLVGAWEPHDPVDPELRRELEADPRVRVRPHDWRIQPYYGALDVFVLPSHREGFPVVVLEASAMGLPVVATRALGIVDAVRDGETGTLVPLSDPAALAGAVGRYVADPEVRLRHGRAGRALTLTSYRPRDLWEAVEWEYLRLLEGPRSARGEEDTSSAQRAPAPGRASSAQSAAAPPSLTTRSEAP